MTQEVLTQIEARRAMVQERLDSARPQAERNRLGQFATPQSLAVEIARFTRQLVGPVDALLDFADPAFGTGSFYSALLTTFPRDQVRSAVGIEIDRDVLSAARSLWRGANLRLVEGDFTDPKVLARCRVRPNLVLTNPPYVRHHHLDRDEKRRLQGLVWKQTGLRVNGLAGLYVYYFLIATEWMQDGGIAAWLVPSEFMEVNYGVVLRHYLSRAVTLLHVHRFNPAEVQFDDALVSSAVVVFKKEAPALGALATFSYGGSLEHPQAVQAVSVSSLKHEAKWTRFPASSIDSAGAEQVAGMTLGDIFRIQRGIATGCNGFFILPRTRARELRLPEECLRPILPSPRALRESVIPRGPDGYPAVGEQLVLIDCAMKEADVRRRYPRLWAYLQTAGERGILNGYLVNKRSPWYKQESRPPAPFLCTYMGRGTRRGGPFRFIFNRSDATAANVYLLLYPAEVITRLIAAQPGVLDAIYRGMCQIESSAFRRQGREYGGGLQKVEPKELARVTAAPILASCAALASAIASRQAPQLFAQPEVCVGTRLRTRPR